MRRAAPIAALAVAVFAALVLGGCGIPDDSDVHVLGPGPSAGPQFGDDNTPPIEYSRTDTTDPGTFVNYFLQAAAGDPDGALARVKDFLAPDIRAGFKPQSQGTQVVRLADTPLINPGDTNVTLTVQQVGTLQDNGELVPSSDPSTAHYGLKVGPVVGQTGLFVLSAPQMLLLTDTALESYYQPHTIYFWNSDNTGLVPDLRYMPMSVPTVQQPTTIVNWLTGGPADWLQGAAQGLPQGAAAQDNIPAASDDKLEITFNAKTVAPGDTKALDRLDKQLQWSLRSLAPHTLEIRIGNQDPVSFTSADYPDSNASARLLDQPERFVIYNGVIRRLSDTVHSVAAIPVIKQAANKSIQYAAMSSSTTHTFAAVVTTSGKSQALHVAVAPDGQDADLKTVKGLSGTLGHPVWAITAAGDTDTAIGLITADGKLFSYGSNGSAAQPVEWQSGDPGAITAVSVAPDGHRVLVVAGGKLYRTVLTITGDGVGLATPAPILVTGLRTVTAAAWSSETWFDVAGVRSINDRYQVDSVSLDGALTETRLVDIGTEPVSYLTSYPANPVTKGKESGYVSYVAGSKGNSWDVLSEPVSILASDLAGPAGSAAPGAVPTAPFFLD